MANITVDKNTNLQTMIGWEATAQIGHEDNAITDSYEYPSTTLPNYYTALRAGIIDFGLNRVRLEINFFDWNASGSYYWSGPTPPFAIQPSTSTVGQRYYNRISSAMDSFVTNWRNDLITQGESLYINLCLVDFKNEGYHLEDTPSEFAFFVNKTIEWFYTTYGYLPNSLEVLEPDNSGGNQNWTAAKLANNIVAANTLLVSNGYSGIKWMAPTSTTLANVNTWIADMKTANAAVIPLIQEYSYHLYGGDDSDLVTLKTTAIADGKTTAMLESTLPFGGISADIHRLYKDLTIGYGSSWQQFTIAYPYPGAIDGGGEYFFVDTSTWAVSLSTRAKYLRHYFKYVRNGAIMKGVNNTTSDFQGLPFMNTNGNYVMPIKCATSGVVDISGLPGGTYGIRYTLGDGVNAPSSYDVALSNQTISNKQNVTFTMPGQGVATVYNINYLTPPAIPPRRQGAFFSF